MSLTATASDTVAPAPASAAPINSEPRYWLDGRLIDPAQPVAPLNTHALHYGSAVFEGIRSYATADGAAVFRLPEHLERMQRGATMIGMTLDTGRMRDAILETLRANRHRDAYIRPLAWFGAGGFGLDVEGHDSHLMVATSSTNVHLTGGRARLTVSAWRRNPADSLPPLKLCGAYVNSILAKREAKARGFDEALFVDHGGKVVECTGANVFMVRDGKVTAVEHRDALPGVTRDTLIHFSGAESRAVTREELLEADEVFACGTAAEVAPVACIDDRSYGDNPITRELRDLYARTVRGQVEQYRHWLTQVTP
ncbi:MAG: aminotransferase class IV [Lysobacteraceae bacterium]